MATVTAVRRGERGQATAEHVGLTLVVALLMGALAVWMSAQVHAPDRPPDVIGRIAAPFTTPEPVPHGAPYLVVPPGMQGRPGLFHQAWDGLLTWGRANVDAEGEALGGFVDEMKAQAERVVGDPLGTVVRVAAALRGVPSLPIPSSGGQQLAPQEGNPLDQVSVWGYLYEIGKRPWYETFMGLSRIAGKRAADYVVTRWLKWLGARVAAFTATPTP